MHQMKTLLGLAVAAALGTAAMPASAIDPASSGNGEAILTAWDPTTGNSIIQGLGYTLSQLAESTLTPEGGTVLNFGSVANFTSTFGANNTNVRWTVTAADSLASAGQFAGRALATTGALGLVPTSLNVTNTGLRDASNNQNTIVGNVNVAPTYNAGTDSAIATDGVNGSLNYYGGGSALSPWGDRLGGAIPFDAYGSVNQALGFYYFASAPTNSPILQGAQFVQTRQVYANSENFGQWLLTGDGQLSYSIAGVSAVPLPAAVWLLLSGLGGLGVLGRRRKEGPALAAA